MKLIKMLGLGVVVALMATALGGGSSAMAETTALCEVDPGPGAHEVCPAGKLVSHVHETTLAGKKAKLLTIGTIECEVLFLGDVKSANLLSNPLDIRGKFTYSSCSLGCTVAETTGTEALILKLKLGHETAEVLGEWEVRVECKLINVKCTYNGIGIGGIAKGPLLANSEMPNGEVNIEEQVLTTVTGPNCPTTTKLDLLLGPLTATYITN